MGWVFFADTCILLLIILMHFQFSYGYNKNCMKMTRINKSSRFLFWRGKNFIDNDRPVISLVFQWANIIFTTIGIGLMITSIFVVHIRIYSLVYFSIHFGLMLLLAIISAVFLPKND